MLNIVVPAILTLIALFMAYISYKFPFHKEDGKPTKAGRIFGILIALSILGLGYVVYAGIKLDKENATKKSLEKAHEDSVINNASNQVMHNVDSALKSRDLQYNAKTKTIKVIDSSQKKIEPEMEIYRDSTGLFGTFYSNMKLRVTYYCANTATAYIRKINLMSFTWDKNGLIDLSNEEPIKIYNGTKSSSGRLVETVARYNIPPPRFDQPLIYFYYFKAIYADKLVAGKVISPPLRGLFYIERSTYNPKKWSDIKFGYIDDQLEYKRMMDTLKKRKLW